MEETELAATLIDKQLKGTVAFGQNRNKKKKIVQTILDSPYVIEGIPMSTDEEDHILTAVESCLSNFGALGELKRYNLPVATYEDAKKGILLEKLKDFELTKKEKRRHNSQVYSKLYSSLKQLALASFMSDKKLVQEDIDNLKLRKRNLVLGINAVCRKIEQGAVQCVLYEKNTSLPIVDLLLPLCKHRKTPVLGIHGLQSLVGKYFGLKNGSSVLGLVSSSDREFVQISKLIADIYHKHSNTDGVAQDPLPKMCHSEKQTLPLESPSIEKSFYLSKKEDGGRAFIPGENICVPVEREESFISLRTEYSRVLLKPLTLTNEIEPKKKKLKKQ